MISEPVVVAIVVGALLALVFIETALRSGRPAKVFAAGLVVAAGLYVLFALWAGDRRAAALEAAGTGLFALFALAGARWSPHWLAAGWTAHVAWDLLLHPVQGGGYAPWWYPAACIGFDLLVAGAVLGAAREGRLDGPA